MKAKFTKLSIALLAGAMAAPLAFAEDQGTVTFTGRVQEDTCNLATGSANQTVELGTVSASALSAVKSNAGSKMFDIVVENCGASISKVAAHFETDNIDVDSENTIKNTASGNAAQNVTVQLVDRDGTTPIALGSTGTSRDVTGGTETVGGGATLTYGGRLYSSKGGATAGEVLAITRFTLAYN